MKYWPGWVTTWDQDFQEKQQQPQICRWHQWHHSKELSFLMRVKEENGKAGLKLNIQKTKIMAFSPITSWQIEQDKWKQWQILFRGLQNNWGWWLHPGKEKNLAPWKKSYDKPRQYIKKQSDHFADKALYSPSCGFSSSHVQMWELDRKEGWTPNNWCFWIVVLEKTLEIPLDSKEIKPVNPKGKWNSLSQVWLFATPRTIQSMTFSRPEYWNG